VPLDSSRRVPNRRFTRESFSCFPDEVACKSRVCLRLSGWRPWVRRVLFWLPRLPPRAIRLITTSNGDGEKARCSSLRCSALCCFSPPPCAESPYGSPSVGWSGWLSPRRIVDCYHCTTTTITTCTISLMNIPSNISSKPRSTLPMVSPLEILEYWYNLIQNRYKAQIKNHTSG
jgi:hypothetical protein